MLLGWLECEQRDVITFLREENRALKAQLAGRRLRLTDAQRRRLAVLGHRLGRAVLEFLEGERVQIIRTPFRAPNCNAYAERFVRSIKEECLNRVVLLGERHLRRTIAEFVAHYHAERNHQGIGNELIQPLARADCHGPLRRRQRIGGMLNYYYRAA